MVDALRVLSGLKLWCIRRCDVRDKWPPFSQHCAYQSTLNGLQNKQGMAFRALTHSIMSLISVRSALLFRPWVDSAVSAQTNSAFMGGSDRCLHISCSATSLFCTLPLFSSQPVKVKLLQIITFIILYCRPSHWFNGLCVCVTDINDIAGSISLYLHLENFSKWLGWKRVHPARESNWMPIWLRISVIFKVDLKYTMKHTPVIISVFWHLPDRLHSLHTFVTKCYLLIF